MRIFTICALTLLALGGTAAAQSERPEPYQEGLHYFEIDQAPAMAPKQMELTEFFSYLCTHCNTFEPYLDSWKKRKPDHVNFVRVPVVFGRGSWELYARAYITSRLMGATDEAHLGLMDELWKKKNILRSLEELADFYTQFGLDREKFLSTANSFAVDGKMRKDQQLLGAYGIRSTPTVVLNGKYRISGNAAVPNFEVLLDVVDYLIAKETAMLTPADLEAASEGP